MKVKFNESDLFQQFDAIIREHNMTTTMSIFELTTKGVFKGIAKYLGLSKNTENPVGLTITNFKGGVDLIAYCKHVESAEGQDETAGSWLIDFSFNPEDMPKDCKVVDIKEPIVFNTFDDAARSLGYFYPNNSDFIAIAISITRCIVDWLDVNAREGESVELELDGVFTAKVDMENNEKIMGIVVSEEIKNVCKGSGDDLLSKGAVK